MSETGAAATALIEANVREGTYGDRIAAVEPGGAEFIPLAERHGKPHQQFWTWVSPNMEFATVFVGFIAIWFFDQPLPAAIGAIVVGTALGSLTMGVLAARGPLYGVPQMILSRIGFGRLGNILPAGINSLVAGVGWFAVNSVSGALALSALTSMPDWLSLIIIAVAQIVVAFLGHNFVHTFERIAFPILVAAFAVASVSVVSHAAPSAVPGHGGIGGFLLTVGAAFGYAAGWNPYASDYTRYLPRDTDRRATGWWAGFGVFLSCILLETMGALAATAVGIDKFGDNPTEGFTSIMPTWIADFALVAIALGAVCANALNVYSGAMSFLAMGVRLPLALRRALVALVFGVAGFFLALSGLKNAGVDYTNFLLIIAYWIGPWLGVFLTDQWLRRGRRVDGFLFDKRHNPWAGAAAFAIATGLSVWLFSAQEDYHGYFAHKFPSIGDIAFEVGFVLAALLYWLFFHLQGGADREEELVMPGAAPVTTAPADAAPVAAAPVDAAPAEGVTTEGT